MTNTNLRLQIIFKNLNFQGIKDEKMVFVGNVKYVLINVYDIFKSILWVLKERQIISCKLQQFFSAVSRPLMVKFLDSNTSEMPYHYLYL